MFKRVFIANRGAVAARVLRAAHELGAEVALAYSPADSELPYVGVADWAEPIGEAPAPKSYLDQELILGAVARSHADALHPGYGFLSENPGFAARVGAAGVTYVGPSPALIEAMGEKTRARALMAAHGMPMAASSALLTDDQAALQAAAEIGYPVLVKPANGGGGIGMLAARSDAELLPALAKARTVAMRAFGDDSVYLESLVERPRHIEFQILADCYGNVMHLHERDCSVQRRHQKVIEECPAPGLPRALVAEMAETATRISAALGYDNIGTVEMLYQPGRGFSFLEMNTRLQVEHAVTEAATGVDIVKTQLRLAAGEHLADVVGTHRPIIGHAIEARLYAEDPVRFLPSPGKLEVFRFPLEAGVRVETGYAEGNTVTPYYDPLLAKLIVHAPDRERAIEGLAAALRATRIGGVRTNIPFLLRVLADARFLTGEPDTGLAADIVATKL